MNKFYPQKYPVFEADQVLSQHHLNQMITYLDNQDRLTRNGAIGMGIICGMQFSFPNANSLHITCGQAITSLGYMVETEATTFTHFHEIVLPDTFLKPDLIAEPYLKNIFDLAAPYSAIKNCTELLDTGSKAADKQAIPTDFFEGKVIIQLLEVDFIDQKNCLSTNCDDKGKRLEFNLRTLLVSIPQAIALGVTENNPFFNAPKLTLPRYNVPHKNLFGPNAILDKFKSIFDQQTILKITKAINELFNYHRANLTNPSSLQFLSDISGILKSKLDTNKDSVQVQYLWDWLHDIVEAYQEIIYLKAPVKTKCCVQHHLFPFHVVIGSQENDVRTQFYPTHDAGGAYTDYSKQLNILFQRLAALIQKWGIDNKGVRITPSCFGRTALSEKAIPFYYGGFAPLLKLWNAKKSITNQTEDIPAYHLNANNEWLLSDLQPYNFFRIEGHIGKPFATSIQQIELLRKTYNLPFQVTALNAADSRSKVLDIMNFKGRWDDLETDYDIARKRLFNITEFVVKWIEANKNGIIEQSMMTAATIAQIKNILDDIGESLPVDLYEFLPEHDDFLKVFKALNEIFLSHRFCIQLGKKELSMLAEDLIDRFDDINALFIEDPLSVIHDEALVRWEKAYKELFFSTFIQQHTGIEHQAGVTRGGTFVLVYLDNSVFKTPVRPKIFTKVLTTVSQYKNSLKFSEEVQKEVSSALITKGFKSGKGRTPIVVSDPCKDEVEKVKANFLDITAKNLGANFTPDVHKMLVDQLHFAFDIGRGANVKDTGFEGLVIADFFIPYICCGKGSTIEIKMEIPESITIGMEKSIFCTNDDELYEIDLGEKNTGSFSGTARGAVVRSDNKLFFKPNHISVREPNEYTLQYSINGISSNMLTLRTESPEALGWVAKPIPEKPNEIVFTNTKATEGREFEIDFGDGSPKVVTKNREEKHVYPLARATPSFTAVIKESGGVCINEQTLPINIINPRVIGDFDSRDFNVNDFNT